MNKCKYAPLQTNKVMRDCPRYRRALDKFHGELDIQRKWEDIRIGRIIHVSFSAALTSALGGKP